jgi:hypothetical protein
MFFGFHFFRDLFIIRSVWKVREKRCFTNDDFIEEATECPKVSADVITTLSLNYFWWSVVDLRLELSGFEKL